MRSRAPVAATGLARERADSSRAGGALVLLDGIPLNGSANFGWNANPSRPRKSFTRSADTERITSPERRGATGRRQVRP